MLHHRSISLTCLALAALAMCQRVDAQDSTATARLLNSDPQHLLEISQEHGNSITLSGIANFGQRDVREAPGNVQVITARQMQASGAKDLYEALQLVPGFSFALGGENAIGVGVHGSWAADGKVLFMLDGKPINENDLGSFNIAGRIPLENVDHIEVQLGPGSLMHGGYASLGVVNIVTRSADQGTSARASLRTGYSADQMTSTMESVSGAHRLSRDQDISYMVSFERGRRSNTLRQMPDSSLLNFADSTAMQAASFQLSYRWRGLKATMAYLQESYAVSDAAHSILSRDVILGLEYKAKVTRKMDVLLRLNHDDQLPWYRLDTSEPSLVAANTGNQRTSALGLLSYKPSTWLSFNLGTEGWHQHTTYTTRMPGAVFALNGKDAINMNDGAVFGEIELAGKPGILSGGYRFEGNDLAGQFASPRVAYSKILGPVNIKLSWSSAFKAPTVMNLNYGPPDEALKAEYATTKEAELGFRLGKSVSLTANVYDTQIKDPITYVNNPFTGERYINRDAAGSTGIDARFSVETKRTTVLAGFGTNDPVKTKATGELPADSAITGSLGLPATRAYLVLAWDVRPSFTLRGKAMWSSEVTSFQYTDNDPKALPAAVTLPTELVLNAGLTWRPGNSNRFSIAADCRNLLDNDRTLVSATTDVLTPYALNGRSYTLALSYKFVQ